MPIQWPVTSWLQSKLERPFPRLVAHFAATIFEGESAAQDVEFGMGGLLALLAVPGGFVSLLLFDKYSSLMLFLRHRPALNIYTESLPDKYFFIVFSMAITGVITVLKWDRILPGLRDYANLAPLPISARTIFSASLTAIFITASLFAADVNAASVVLFPMVVVANRGSVGELAAFAGVHALCVMLASAFSFLACFSLMSALMALLPHRAFRRISLYVRILLIVSMVAMLGTVFVVPQMVAVMPANGNSAVALLPPVWYLALYQSLQGHASPALARFRGTGLRALFAAFATALLFCALSYRLYFMRISESAGTPLFRRRAGWRLPGRWSLPWTNFQRACYTFGLTALFRSEKHCIFFGGFAGMALVAASETALTSFAERRPGVPDAGLLSISLIAAYFVILGLRFVLEMPVELEANWIYQVILDPSNNETAAVARKIMLTVLCAGVIAPTVVVSGFAWGWMTALLHAGFVLVLSILLIDTLLVGFRKIPFTCSFPPFRNNVVVLALLGVLGYFFFTGSGASVEHWMLLRPFRFLWLAPAAAVTWEVLRRIRNDIPPIDTCLIYREQTMAAVQPLNLSGN